MIKSPKKTWRSSGTPVGASDNNMRIPGLGPLISALSGKTSNLRFSRPPFHAPGTILAFTPTAPPEPLPEGPAPHKCSCEAFKLCDAVYQAFTPEQRRVWAQAVKRPNTSSYDLWMKECLTLANQGENLPDEPSPSGGFSTQNLTPGNTIGPPDSCLKIPEAQPCHLCSDPTKTPYYYRITIPQQPCPFPTLPTVITLRQIPVMPCAWAHSTDQYDAIISLTPQGFEFEYIDHTQPPELKATWTLPATKPNCNSPFTMQFEQYWDCCDNEPPGYQISVEPVPQQ